MKLSEFWLDAADKFNEPTPEGHEYRYINQYIVIGVCRVVKIYKSQGKITHAQSVTITSQILAERARLGRCGAAYLWPRTPKGDCARVEFCMSQYRMAQQQEAEEAQRIKNATAEAEERREPTFEGMSLAVLGERYKSQQQIIQQAQITEAKLQEQIFKLQNKLNRINWAFLQLKGELQ